MKAGDETQRVLDVLSHRFNKGIGQGKTYIQQQLRKQQRKITLNSQNNQKRVVMFESDVGDPVPADLSESSTASP